jgi:replicative DNA helicase
MENDLNENKKNTFKGKRKSEETVSPLAFGKVQPQARSLEEAVLGALMLDKDALSVVVDILKSESFYVDAHKSIYKAICALFEKSNPVDLLTVSEQLKTMGELESIGGPFYLVELTNRVASAANIEYHARIVAQKFIQRELIRVSTETIKDAYEDTTDVFDLLDKSEQNLFAITEKNLSRGSMNMSTLVNMAIKQFEELSKKDDGLTGVPSGFTSLDRVTSGWQRSDLIIVAARPGMGKTSFTLAIAKNAALDFNMGVAFFSLEMSSVQLVNRIISMETQIASEKLRKGKLEEYEWQQLYSVVDRLSNVPIFIDDTPGISVFELRAKCRRLKMQHDIQLIVIDYLQLMTAGGDNKGGNREQEISTISRSLKGLAKELNVPVIALSQLSRAVETRGGNKRPQLSDLRECVSADTRVLLQDGSLATIESLVGTMPKVWALNNEHQCIQKGETDLVWKVAKKSVYKISLASGRTIKATAEHRLLGFGGWVTVSEMKAGDRLALLRKIPEPEHPIYIAEEKLILLAHLIGDGSYLKGQPLRYTTATEAHSEIVKKSAEIGFGVKVNRHESKSGSWHQLVFSGNGNRWHPAGINAWFRDLGIFNQRSHEKQIPSEIFKISNQQLALFLRHIWSTDGTIFVPKTENSSSRVAFSTNSRILAEDIATLLLRFNIVARIRTIAQVKEGRQYRDMYSVEVSGHSQQLRFLNEIGSFGSKISQELALRAYMESRISNTNVDTLPNEVFDFIKIEMKSKGISQRKMASMRGTSYGGNAHFNFAPSRDLVKDYAELLESEQLDIWANSDVFWDSINTIEYAGEEDVYDLTVLEHHNWIANGIVSHNSGAIEQDADIVSFIYRPEYYQITEDDDGNSLRGIGEIIIAKHRNGALEDVRLKWDGQFALFSNLEDDAFQNFSQDDFGSSFGSNQGGGQTFSSKLNNNSSIDDVPF